MPNALQYDFNIRDIIKRLKELNAKRVLLQMPNGFKPYAFIIAEELEKAGFEVFISSSPCYGGCDIAEVDALKIKADAIVHLGHYPFLALTSINVVYEPVNLIMNIEQLAERLASILRREGFKVVGLLANAQCLHGLKEISRFLHNKGFKVFIDEKSKGLVLGCDVSAAISISDKVDCLVFIGSGYFHPLGIALKVEKPVLLADPLSMRIEDVRPLTKKMERLKWSAILKAKKARVFGIVVSLKTGQFNIDLALKAVEKIKAKGLQAFTITADEISWERLSAFTEAEAYVIVGCPRIATDNREIFGKPVLDISELDAVLNAG